MALVEDHLYTVIATFYHRDVPYRKMLKLFSKEGKTHLVLKWIDKQGALHPHVTHLLNRDALDFPEPTTQGCDFVLREPLVADDSLAALLDLPTERCM